MIDLKFIFVGVSSVLLLLLLHWEWYLPERVYDRGLKKRSYFTNGILFIINNAVTISFQVSSVFALVLAYSPAASYFALLPFRIQVVAGVIILDWGIWIWHLLNHHVSFLWKFHKCHHSEKYLNATSAVRFHIGELLLSVLWKSALLIIIGIPLSVFAISEFLLTIFAMFHHTNIDFSPRVRFYIEAIIISPYLHRVHHSAIRSEHDSNYGVIFSWWDIIFATKKKAIPVEIGLAGIPEKNVGAFLRFPFTKK